MMFGANRRLDDHIAQCGERHQDVLKRIDDGLSEVHVQFESMRAERDRMHAENGERVADLDRTLMKVALSIVTAFLLTMISQHI